LPDLNVEKKAMILVSHMTLHLGELTDCFSSAFSRSPQLKVPGTLGRPAHLPGMRIYLCEHKHGLQSHAGFGVLSFADRPRKPISSNKSSSSDLSLFVRSGPGATTASTDRHSHPIELCAEWPVAFGPFGIFGSVCFLSLLLLFNNSNFVNDVSKEIDASAFPKVVLNSELPVEMRILVAGLVSVLVVGHNGIQNVCASPAFLEGLNRELRLCDGRLATWGLIIVHHAFFSYSPDV
jgi:hypothetical protein